MLHLLVYDESWKAEPAASRLTNEEKGRPERGFASTKRATLPEWCEFGCNRLINSTNAASDGREILPVRAAHGDRSDVFPMTAEPSRC